MTSAHAHPLNNLPWLSALLCAVLPFIAVHWAYLLAASHEQVPWCFPYIDSCTSISATGRAAPASFVFRGLMLPSAMLMAVFWWLHWRWLAVLDGASRRRHWMLGLGVPACIGLVLYVTVLGEVGDWWRLQRRIGTILFFSFTFLAQLLLAASLRAASSHGTETYKVGHRLLRCCQLMLCIGVFSVVIQLLSEDWHDSLEDAIEWLLALLLQLNFLFCAGLWRRGDWTLEFQPRAP